MIINKYHKIYFAICNNIRTQNRTKTNQPKYTYQRHHIIPKSMGGLDVPSNIVLLTNREHFVAHACLVRFLEGHQKYQMQCALRRFTPKNSQYINSRIYESNYTKWRITHSEKMTGRVVVFTEEHKTNLKNAWDNREEIQCPHCLLVSRSASSMKRWHFDKCFWKEGNDKIDISELRRMSRTFNRHQLAKYFKINDKTIQKYADKHNIALNLGGNMPAPHSGKFYNNGIETRRFYDTDIIPNGYIPGMIDRSFK